MKVIRIESCGECPYSYEHQGYLCCSWFIEHPDMLNVMYKHFEQYPVTPVWCPSMMPDGTLEPVV